MLSKLRVVELFLITTVPAMIVSIYSFPPINLILFTLIGGTFLAVSANVLNQIFEIEQDRLMSRTLNRPLVTGEISVKNASVLASFIALSANVFYSIIYTLVLKPRTNQNIVIGGAAGAAPVLIGWTATGSSLEIGSWLLFLLVFLWTPAHFKNNYFHCNLWLRNGYYIYTFNTDFTIRNCIFIYINNFGKLFTVKNI